MWFRQLEDNQTHALTHLLGDSASGEALVIDPQACDWALVQALVDDAGCDVKAVLLTHNHRPERLARLLALGVPVFHGGHWHNLPPGTDWPTQRLSLGRAELQLLPTPGHTPDCHSFLCKDRLFCGDVLDVSVCSEQPWPTNERQLWDSLWQHVLTLPGDTLLYPAHTTQGRSVLNLRDYPHLAPPRLPTGSRDACAPHA